MVHLGEIRSDTIELIDELCKYLALMNWVEGWRMVTNMLYFDNLSNAHFDNLKHAFAVV